MNTTIQNRFETNNKIIVQIEPRFKFIPMKALSKEISQYEKVWEALVKQYHCKYFGAGYTKITIDKEGIRLEEQNKTLRSKFLLPFDFLYAFLETFFMQYDIVFHKLFIMFNHYDSFENINGLNWLKKKVIIIACRLFERR